VISLAVATAGWVGVGSPGDYATIQFLPLPRHDLVEQLTTLPGADVSIKLEIDAEVSSGLDRAKVRTLVENATTLGFIDKHLT